MFVVGLTGGIGSGKSTVADLFAAHGVPLVDTDLIAHRITAPHGIAMPQIAAEFGDSFVAADGSHFAVRQLQQICSLETDRTRELARRLRDEPHQRHRGDRLAAAGFTDDGQSLAFVDMEGSAINCTVDTLGGTEMDLQIVDFEQCHLL